MAYTFPSRPAHPNKSVQFECLVPHTEEDELVQSYLFKVQANISLNNPDKAYYWTIKLVRRIRKVWKLQIK